MCSVGTEWVPKRDESKIFYQDLLRPLGIGTENEESSQHDVCYRSGHETGELDFGNGRRSGELQSSCLFPWSESPGHPQGAPVGGGGWNKAFSRGR